MPKRPVNNNERFIPNSFQTPNAYVDDLMYLLTSAEWKVLSYTVRRIFGFQKRTDRISVSQYVSGTISQETGKHLDHGTGLSTASVVKALNELIHYGVIERVSQNDSHINNGAEYRLTFEASAIDFFGLNSRAQDWARAATEKIKAANEGRFKERNAPPSSHETHPFHPLKTQYTGEIQKKTISAGETATSVEAASPDSTPVVIDVLDQFPHFPGLKKALKKECKFDCLLCGRRGIIGITAAECPDCGAKVEWHNNTIFDAMTKKARADAEAKRRREALLDDLLPGTRYLVEEARRTEEIRLGIRRSHVMVTDEETKKLLPYESAERGFGKEYIAQLTDRCVAEGDMGRKLITHVINALPFAAKRPNQPTDKPARIGVLTDSARAMLEQEKAQHDHDSIPDGPSED